MNQAGDLRVNRVVTPVLILDQEGDVITYGEVHEVGKSFPQDRPVFSWRKHRTLDKPVFQGKNPAESFRVNSLADHREFIHAITKPGLEIQFGRSSQKPLDLLDFPLQFLIKREEMLQGEFLFF